MFQVLGVSRAHYYRHLKLKVSNHQLEGRDLKQRIFRIFAEFKGRCGVMKIQYMLRQELEPLQRRCSPMRVSRLMWEMDIRAITIAKWEVTSSSKQRQNLLNWDFSTNDLNQKWVIDIIYISTKLDGWCYLSTIIDLQSAIHLLNRWIRT